VSPSLLVAAALASAGWAADPVVDRSIDTQLVHPALTPGAALVVDTPRGAGELQLAAGAAWQLEQDPLRYTLETGGSGAVVSSRNTLHLGASLAVTERTTVFLRASGAQLGAGDLDIVAPASALALGDLALGVKGSWVEQGPLAVGPAVGLWLPVGTTESWVSEDSLRYAPALLASLRWERLELLTNVGMLARVEVDSGADFVASPELSTGAALCASATPWLGGLVELSSRHGLGNFMKPGAENPVVLQGGLRLTSQRWGRVDLVGGTGLTQGYGVSPVRVMVSVVGWTGLRPEAPEPELSPVVAAPAPDPAPVIEPAPAVEVAPRRAWVEHGQLVLDAPIAFEGASATLTAASEPLLDEVARVVLDYPQIELLVVQGHADELGALGADYELSLRRARVVFEGLVERAVRPERISYRGMGSAVPDTAGAPRGVDLLVAKVRPLQQGAAPFDERDILLPWSGEAVVAGLPGDKLLGVDGHPILEVQVLPDEAPVDEIPTEDSFLQALDEHDALEPLREEAP